MIDLVLAGDNAVAVGLAAGGLPKEQRRKAILYGLAAAVILRIGFALITTWLLGVVGLLLAGGLVLLWVCWKMWRNSASRPMRRRKTPRPSSTPTARPWRRHSRRRSGGGA